VKTLKKVETERLYLRELVLDDLYELSKILCDTESMQYYPEPFSQEREERGIHCNIDNYKKYIHGLWAVILKD
jgi:RimJ/RimL family protein N-acetyltransferase